MAYAKKPGARESASGQSNPRAEYVLGELAASVVRRVASHARRRNIGSSFDFLGPATTVSLDACLMQRAMSRVLHAAAQMLHAGDIACLAENHAYGAGKCVYSMKVTAVGNLVSDDQMTKVLQRLELAEDSPCESRLHRARGCCPLTGAPIEFSSSFSRGALFSVAWTLPVRTTEVADVRLDVRHAHAWIIDPQKTSADTLARRLQRLGWTVSVFESPVPAARRLQRMTARTEMPTALLAIEGDAVSLASVQSLTGLLGDQTQAIHAVFYGSSALHAAGSGRDLEIRLQPFSPGDLLAMTKRVALGRDDPRAAWPAEIAERPLMLIVDDDPVARSVNTSLGHALGYEVVTASDGLEAIEQCRRWFPHAILMDVEMPRLDGLAATRRLRELEKAALIPRSRIVAVTAAELENRAAIQGVDAWLPKPLTMDSLVALLGAVDGVSYTQVALDPKGPFNK